MGLTVLKGIGPKTEELFNKLGVYAPGDLLYYFPKTYIHYEAPVAIGALHEGETQAVTGQLEKDATILSVHGKTIVQAVLRDMSGKLRLTWFNATFLRSRLRAGMVLTVYGKVSSFRGMFTMAQPKLYDVSAYQKKIDTLEPVYGQTKGLSNASILKAVTQAFLAVPGPAEYLPDTLLAKRQLPALRDAMYRMHFPKDMEDFKLARKRLAYDELLLFQLAIKKSKGETDGQRSDYVLRASSETDALLGSLPYQLTDGQKQAIKEIRSDMSSSYVMNRLLQGDVGSGKTIVAFAAMLDAAFGGYQAALMAPTEILAEQHAKKLKDLIETHHLAFSVSLLTGSLKAKERKDALEDILTGKAQLIVGTHALFQEDVRYHELALVITDEQHRFGVNQRRELSNKGEMPHTLVMSATPIPRTLSLLIYQDMKVSRITERPGNRLPIKNAVVDESYRNRAYKFIYDEIKKDHQAYVICPMVEENDTVEIENVTEYAEKLRKVFPADVSLGILHGKLKPQEKDAIMGRFLRHEIDLLVSTTVVEVGVDVPNATVMMVENAERFGLAQLHQLRGRVGRSGLQSYCIFVDTKHSETSQKRLSILSSSNDGFEIAEQDLKLRGPGDIFGLRQSGALDFGIADIYEDGAVLQEASVDAEEVLRADPALQLPENKGLRFRLSQYVEKRATL